MVADNNGNGHKLFNWWIQNTFTALSAVVLGLVVFVWSNRTVVVDRKFEKIQAWQNEHDQKDGHREMRVRMDAVERRLDAMTKATAKK